LETTLEQLLDKEKVELNSEKDRLHFAKISAGSVKQKTPNQNCVQWLKIVF
jgi:hypothetical protein